MLLFKSFSSINAKQYLLKQFSAFHSLLCNKPIIFYVCFGCWSDKASNLKALGKSDGPFFFSFVFLFLDHTINQLSKKMIGRLSDN